jgi:hypothetical protein
LEQDSGASLFVLSLLLVSAALSVPTVAVNKQRASATRNDSLEIIFPPLWLFLGTEILQETYGDTGEMAVYSSEITLARSGM